MGSSTTQQAYGEAWYWDKRYAQESAGSFDWYQKYNSLAPLIRLYIPPLSHHRNRILVVGCGNSALSQGLADDGYEDVVSIDISSVVVEVMQRRYSDRPCLKYLQMDVRDMSGFQTSSFDAVVDKGTLDSLLITYGAPLYRLRLLRDSCSWTIKLHVIEKLATEGASQNPLWEITNAVPLNYDGTSVEAALGNNPDVHYIYVCIKEDDSSKAS
nr:EEF1A lysine methyltransferase 4 isoform X2 [Ziziphus jujuba var. spinosa]